jgi:hypothetical protein
MHSNIKDNRDRLFANHPLSLKPVSLSYGQAICVPFLLDVGWRIGCL